MIWKDGENVQIELWKNFSKRKNSTKIPARPGETLEVALKDATSIENPTFILSGNEFEYNYVKALGHYYFISDLRSVRHNVIEIDCKQDVLATYKNEILVTNAYVLRSASDFNGEVVDNLYPVVANVTYIETLIENFFPVTPGTYVLGVVGIGENTLKQGSVTYYGMSKTMLQTMCSYLFSTDVWQRMKNDYENPLDNIVSCYWIPFDLSSESTEIIKFGRFELEGCTGYVLSNTVRQKFTDVSIPKHPLASTKGVYLNQEPFTRYYAVSTAFGTIPINSMLLINSDSLTIGFSIDVITGQGMLDIGTSEVDMIKAITQFGIPVSLSQNSISIGSMIGTIGNLAYTAGSAITGNIPGAISGSLSAIGSSLSALQGINQTSGANGSFIGARDDLTFIAQFNDITDEDNEHHGRPLCKVKTLSSLNGYTLCSDASVNLSGFSGDKDEVNAYLNSGFYIE